MKKLFAVFATIVLMISVFAFSAFAAAPSISGDTVSVKPGENVTLTFTANNFVSVGALDIKLSYDNDLFTYVGSSQGSFLNGGLFVDNGEGDVYKIGYVNVNGLSGSGPLFTITFKAGTTEGKYAFDLSKSTASTVDGEKIQLTSQSAYVDISKNAKPVSSKADSSKVTSSKAVPSKPADNTVASQGPADSTEGTVSLSIDGVSTQSLTPPPSADTTSTLTVSQQDDSSANDYTFNDVSSLFTSTGFLIVVAIILGVCAVGFVIIVFVIKHRKKM